MIIGENGVGKFILFKIMEGKVVFDVGMIKVGVSVKIVLFF